MDFHLVLSSKVAYELLAVILAVIASSRRRP
jgi:hypothetical protein